MFFSFCKVCIFSFLTLFFTSSLINAQVIGGGSLEKPVSSQLGGLVNSNVFKRLSNTPAKNRQKVQTAKKNTKTTTPPKNTKNTKITPDNSQTVNPVPSNNFTGLTFVPVENAGIDRELATLFTQNTSEQAALLELFKVTKSAYQAEVSKKGKQNDIAMALTFFIATCVTAYHDSPEPTDAAMENLYDTLAELLAQEQTITTSSNIDKQILHDRLIYISGLVLGGYTAAKQDNDANSLMTFRLLAGVCLKSLMQLEPDNLSFDQNGLVVKP